MWRNDESGRGSAIGFVVVVLLAALALAGCGENGGDGQEAATATTDVTERTTDETTTEEEPEEEPITPAEQRWAKQVTRYAGRVERIFVGGAVTKTSIRSELAVLEDCGPMLGRAGDAGRFAPAEKRVRKACERFDRAAAALHRVLDAGGPTAVVGTPEEKIISSGMEVATEAEGNGYNTLTRARDQIAAIRAKLPK
jgi:hypothetical protein